MDRREFVVKAVCGVGSLSTFGCGGGGGATTPKQIPPQPFPSSLAPLPVSSAPSTPAPSSSKNTIQQFLTWDAGSGPSRDYWSIKLQLPWVNPGVGDWLDADQRPQGPRPFTTAQIAPGPVVLILTDLVNRWLTTGQNRGVYLRSDQAWPAKFSGRSDTKLERRPALTVETDAGTTTLLGICSAEWTPSSYQGIDSRNSFNVAQGAHFAAIQFDLSSLEGPAHRATLTLTCLSSKTPASLQAFELNPPAFTLGSDGQTVQRGIAQHFAFDQGLDRHPDVLFAGDFADISRARWQTGAVAAGSQQLQDSRTGSSYLRSLIPTGQFLGCDLEHSIVSGTSTGIPQRAETDLYARYCVLLENDWGSEVDANKMPGWDGRLGWWNEAGFWQSTTGNGGVRPTGLKVRNVAAHRWEYEGASMRGLGGPRSNDGNPYDDLFWLGSYMYHLDQAGDYGELLRWSGAVLDRGRWHSIEQHIRMNSVVGPFDAIGNGVAAQDGQYSVWIDGVLSFRRANLRWRRHPEMGLQGFWLNWYHGGSAASPHDMHFRMDSLVIARTYIGPRNGDI